MNPAAAVVLKTLGSTVGAAALVASGSGLATFMKEKTEIRIETLTPSQEQHGDGIDRYTKLTEIEGTNLFLEYSHINMMVGGRMVEQNYYIFDHIHNEIVHEILYIINSQNKNIRVTKRKPPKEHNGLYKTWILHQFNHSGFGESLYGYCPPPEITEESKRVCDHLPNGWTTKPVGDDNPSAARV